jgi:hypothetical protein
VLSKHGGRSLGWTLQQDLVFLIIADRGRSFVDRQELWAYSVLLFDRCGCNVCGGSATIGTSEHGVAFDLLTLNDLSILEFTLFSGYDETNVGEAFCADTETLSELGFGRVIGQEDERLQSSNGVQFLVDAPQDIIEKRAQVRRNSRGRLRLRLRLVLLGG